MLEFDPWEVFIYLEFLTCTCSVNIKSCVKITVRNQFMIGPRTSEPLIMAASSILRQAARPREHLPLLPFGLSFVFKVDTC
jgi:hypothetical protein